MNPSRPSPPSYVGRVTNGVIVLDAEAPLAEGQPVRVEPLEQGADAGPTKGPADRVGELQRLFDEWTDEDGRLPDEEADRLRAALDKEPRLSLRPANLD